MQSNVLFAAESIDTFGVSLRRTFYCFSLGIILGIYIHVAFGVFFVFMTCYGIYRTLFPQTHKISLTSEQLEYVDDEFSVAIPLCDIVEIIEDRFDESGQLFVIWKNGHLTIHPELHRQGWDINKITDAFRKAGVTCKQLDSKSYTDYIFLFQNKYRVFDSCS